MEDLRQTEGHGDSDPTSSPSIKIEASQLSAATGSSTAQATIWLEPICEAMARFQVNTPQRVAAFLAQIGHESAGMQFTRERWGPTLQQLGYEGRKDLGNAIQGDGYRYRGRGLIQITGRKNYERAGQGLSLDLVTNPELLESREHAASSAAWWWAAHGCNEFADAGDFASLTKRINGGLNGYEHRCLMWTNAKRVLAL